MVRSVLVAAAALTAVLAPPARAASTETMYLDIQATGGTAPSVSTARALEAGRHYTLVMSGTMSIWPSNAWQGGTGCGVAEAFPQTPSPGRRNGPVGLDAETVFATTKPLAGLACPSLPTALARLYTAFGVLLDTGSGPRRPVPVDGVHLTPTPDHAYTYDIVGAGAPLTASYQARRGADDYGVLTLTVSSDAPDPVPPAPAGPGPGPGPAPGTTGPPATSAPPVPAAAPARPGCRRRWVRLRIRNRRHRQLVRGTALYAGRHRTLKRTRRGLRGRLDVRGLSRRTLRIKVVARTRAGRTIVLRRRRAICRR